MRLGKSRGKRPQFSTSGGGDSGEGTPHRPRRQNFKKKEGSGICPEGHLAGLLDSGEKEGLREREVVQKRDKGARCSIRGSSLRDPSVKQPTDCRGKKADRCTHIAPQGKKGGGKAALVFLIKSICFSTFRKGKGGGKANVAGSVGGREKGGGGPSPSGPKKKKSGLTSGKRGTSWGGGERNKPHLRAGRRKGEGGRENHLAGAGGKRLALFLQPKKEVDLGGGKRGHGPPEVV